MRVKLSVIPFFVLFPGYFLYQWAALHGFGDFFLGGYLNEVSVLLCVVFFFAWVFAGARLPRKMNTIDLCFLVFIAWFAGVVLVHAALGTAPVVTKSHAAAWLQMLACYLVTRHLAYEHLKTLSTGSVWLLATVVLWAAQMDFTRLVVALAGGESEHSATYQSLARAFLVTAAMALLVWKSKLQRWFGYLVCLMVLFILGARSELLGGVILALVYELALSERKAVAVASMAVFSVLGVLLLYIYFDALAELFPESRFLALLVRGAEDGSVLERAQQQASAWSAVLHSPILGDYGHYETGASVGAYSHNWLSAWVDLGLVGLLLFVVLQCAAVWTAVQVLRASSSNRNSDAHRLAALALGMVTMFVVFAVFAKSFTDAGVATAVGIVASLRARDINNGRRVGMRLRSRFSKADACRSPLT
jgi:hypothetical protein